ncbi:MAG: amidohydrolase family protein [Alphaproteobacteria bacterium]|nr:amidohydrolase family protein [Alphaproteobacteria bacterium]
MTAMIDMHTHWRPAEAADALRARTREPRILRDAAGGEVLKSRMGDEALDKAFDRVEQHLERMDRQGVETSVLSLLGSFCWVEAQPLDLSGPLCRDINNALSAICAEHAGRFAAFAALPLVDMNAAAAELERALGLPGVIGAQLPGNAFLTRKEAEAMRPLLEVADRNRAVLFVHHGPRPGDAFPKVGGETDNARRRNGTLDMQASLSSVMVTLCLTDALADYPDVTVVVHNLGGNIPYEVERMDHRCLLDTPDEELPSSRFRKAKVYVDCNSFGPHAIEAAVRLYGADRIVCGTDGTAFGVDWTRKALEEAAIDVSARDQILRGNAATMLARALKPELSRAAAE